MSFKVGLLPGSKVLAARGSEDVLTISGGKMAVRYEVYMSINNKNNGTTADEKIVPCILYKLGREG